MVTDDRQKARETAGWLATRGATGRLGRVADWLWRLERGVCTTLGFSLRTVTDVEGPIVRPIGLRRYSGCWGRRDMQTRSQSTEP